MIKTKKLKEKSFKKRFPEVSIYQKNNIMTYSLTIKISILMALFFLLIDFGLSSANSYYFVSQFAVSPKKLRGMILQYPIMKISSYEIKFFGNFIRFSSKPFFDGNTHYNPAAITISRDGVLGAISMDKDIHIFIFDRFQLKSKFNASFAERHGGGAVKMAFSPDNRFLLAGNSFGEVLVYDIAKMKILRLKKLHSGKIKSLHFSKKNAISTGEDGKILKWNIRTGEILFQYTFQPAENFLRKIDKCIFNTCLKIPVMSSDISPEGRYLAVSYGDDYCKNQDLKIWDIMENKLFASIRHDLGIINCIKYFPDGKALIFAGSEGKVRIHRFPNLKLSASYQNSGHFDSQDILIFEKPGTSVKFIIISDIKWYSHFGASGGMNLLVSDGKRLRHVKHFAPKIGKDSLIQIYQ